VAHTEGKKKGKKKAVDVVLYLGPLVRLAYESFSGEGKGGRRGEKRKGGAHVNPLLFLLFVVTVGPTGHGRRRRGR